MGNLIYSADVLTVSSTVKYSELSAFPADNVTSITYPWRLWKANSGVAGQWVGLNLGSAKAVKAVVIDHVNFTSAKIQADAAATFDSDGGNPQYDSTALTVSKDPRDGRYKLIHTCDQTYQYWRCYCNSTPVSGTGTYLYVGAMCALGSYVTLSANPGFTYDTTPKEPTLNEGSGEPVSIGHGYVELGFNSTNYGDDVSFESELLALLVWGKAQPLVIYRNNSNTSEVYIAYRIGDTTWQRAGPRHGRFTALKFRQASELLAG